MGWIWGEKRLDPIKLKVDKETKLEDIVRSNIRIHLDLKMDHPFTVDLVEAVKSIDPTFRMPVGIDVNEVTLTHIEFLGADKDD